MKALTAEFKCPKCGSVNVEVLGEDCQTAERSFPIQDYYGDGSKYVHIGYHHNGYKCVDCGDADADVCIHD